MSINFGQNPNLNTSGYTPAAATVTSIPFNNRILLDGNYIANVGLPVAANVVNTNALNFYVSNPFPTTETINVTLILGASTGSNNTKNLNVGLQTTEDNNGSPNATNWLAMPTLANVLLTVADNGSSANPGGSVTVRLPPLGQCKQYIRLQCSGEANGGTPVGNATIEVGF